VVGLVLDDQGRPVALERRGELVTASMRLLAVVGVDDLLADVDGVLGFALLGEEAGEERHRVRV
jgi:hypothetical protein